MKSITINGRFYPQVFGSSIPGPIWKAAMEAALATTPETKFDLQTIDNLGVYVPPPPKPTAPAATASPGISGSPAPNPSGTGATPGPSTKPNPSPSPKP